MEARVHTTAAVPRTFSIQISPCWILYLRGNTVGLGKTAPPSGNPIRHQYIRHAMLRCMRTTLSLDEDVAAQLEAWRAKQKLTFKEAVNSALRRGLNELSRPRARKPFRTNPIDMGLCRLAN